jgi:predicted DNA-binding transcriptional regulator YafY
MPDAPSRVERVLNLLALLLDTRVAITREEIVREVDGYPEAMSAYRRAFERDKETLRGMGVPITTEMIGDAGEIGYRVRPDDYYLPDLGLTPEEAAALRVAVSAVQLGNREGVGALMKLGGVGDETAAPIASLPIAPALATLFDAFRHRAVVTFSHRGRSRTVEPWGLSSKRGQWYLVGFDCDRDAVRAFRADRIEGDVEVGPPDAFTAPADFRPDEHVQDTPWLLGDEAPISVQLAVDAAHRDGLLNELGADSTIVDDEPNRTVVELTVTNLPALRTFVLGYLEHVEVVGPKIVREEIIAWLKEISKS